MKFLLDVCAGSQTLHRELADAGHDVLSAADGYADASDELLLVLAHKQGLVLVTMGKDSGALVFVHRLAHPCIVRLAGPTPDFSA